MKITIVDYGIGNLHSIRKGLERAGAKTDISSDMSCLPNADCVVFPGVGAFGEAMSKLEVVADTLSESLSEGMPALGICLGMQILLERSEESDRRGLGFIAGSVKRLNERRVPQMGWNNVDINSEDPVFEGVPSGCQFYFANSFVCFPEEKEQTILSETTYGKVSFPSSVRKKNVFGFQFHPEKSATAGLRILENFVGMAEGL